MRAVNLRTEHMVNPIGIDIKEPYLSWTCEDGIRQTAYEIEAECGGAVVFRSGKVAGNKMHAFSGAAAKSRRRVTWRVRLWDENDVPGAWSEPAYYEMGLLEREQFAAAWINPELHCDPQAHKPASYLWTTFTAPKGERARLYVTCHGVYEAWINGQRAGDFVLAPGTYNYDKRLAYQTIDVTGLVREGENEVQVILGDGWYRSVSGVDGDRNLYGTDVALYFQLEIDGRPVCVSDGSWQASQSGPLRENDMQQGETYDARMEDITDWHGVKTEDFGVDTLCCSNCVPIVENERFSGRLMKTPDGGTVIDFGQNLAGYVSFALNAHAGDTIVLTHGETLDENGNFTQENFQDRKRHKEGGTHQRVTYICKEGENRYKARFTIWGFRYAKVETDIDLSGAQFYAVAVYSRMEQTGTFVCSDESVNRLVQNSIWSQKSNFCDVPTDCPTRERAAWTGDMGVFADTGLFLADCYPIIRKWLAECRIAQHEDGKIANIAPKNNNPGFFSGLLAGSVGWGDACILVPYALYRRSGDRRILEENYEMMQRWYEFLQRRAAQKQEPQKPDLSAIPEQYRAMAEKMPPEQLMQMMQKMAGGGGKQNPYGDYTIDTGVDYGEWCEPDVESTDVMGKPQPQVATAYFAYSGRLLSEIAGILGRQEDAARYREISEKAKQAYRVIATEDGTIRSDRQADYVRAIAFDLLSGEEKERAAAGLNELVIKNDYHLNTGFLSTPSLCRVLADYGFVETAYRLLLQDTCPSWLYAVKKGATTIWETWDGIGEKGEVKASLNHYSYGAVCGWLFAGVCGIRLENGEITIKPQPHPSLRFARASYDSPVGKIESGWRCEDGQITCEISIPANVRAQVILPDGRREEIFAGRYTYAC